MPRGAWMRRSGLNWDPHLHVLAAAGAFTVEGEFLPPSTTRFGSGSTRKILDHVGRRFEPLKLPGRSPPLFEGYARDLFPDCAHDPFPDYGPQQKGRSPV